MRAVIPTRGRGGRGRGNCTAERQKSDKLETEADIAEITSGGVSCFNAEITSKLSDLSTCNDDDDDDDESQDRPAPTVLFTAADDSQEKKDPPVLPESGGCSDGLRSSSELVVCFLVFLASYYSCVCFAWWIPLWF